jgi:hypothetical protein
LTSVADPHHIDADLGLDPNPTYHFDMDPDADPGPDFYLMQIWIRIQRVTLMQMRILIQIPKMMSIHVDLDADLDPQHWIFDVSPPSSPNQNDR